LGESGIRLDEGTRVCPFDLKKSKKDWRKEGLAYFGAGHKDGDNLTAKNAKSAKIFTAHSRRKEALMNCR
jgi:hypothetical protein